MSGSMKKVVDPLDITGTLKGSVGLGGPKKVGMSGRSKEAQYLQMLAELRAQIPQDQAKILAEAYKQKELGEGYAKEYAGTRDSSRDQLAQLLAEQQKRELLDRIPDIAEQANLKGIFRSTGTGNAIAREASDLSKVTSEQLAKQALADREAGLTDTQNVNNQYLQGRYGALEREMSLEDYINQARVGKTVGQALTPQQYSGGKTGSQAAVTSGALGAVGQIGAAGKAKGV